MRSCILDPKLLRSIILLHDILLSDVLSGDNYIEMIEQFNQAMYYNDRAICNLYLSMQGCNSI